MTDALDAPRRLLAELDAETRQEEARLQTMLSQGHDFFHSRIHQALPQMGDHDLDGFAREAGALAAMVEPQE